MRLRAGAAVTPARHRFDTPVDDPVSLLGPRGSWSQIGVVVTASVAPPAPTRGVVVGLALITLLGTAPHAAAQSVRAFNQRRSTFARADAGDTASRADSIAGFGTFVGNIHVASLAEPARAEAWAIQNSAILGDSTRAEGEARAESNGDAAAAGKSDFQVRFWVQARTGFVLLGHVEARGAMAGAASAVITLLGPGSAVATRTVACASDGPSPCTSSDDLFASGILEPGTYTLEARSHAEGRSAGAGSQNVTRAGAQYRVSIQFDGPIVDVGPTTWAKLKSLYR